MDNFERGKKLFKDANDILREVENYLRIKNWNQTVRRSQEVVELSLKAVLKIIGIEYPKEHDIGEFFVKALRRKGIKIKDVQNIIEISDTLSEQRLPAFYREKDCTKEEAEDASKKARWIFEFVKKLLEKLGVMKEL